ncbi:MAG: T9SS type A sorting domain-containing protein [Pedobacter sp.]|nr:T9SS type A sorting domain-containing protein [Chitinophagaceae bacterium]
MVVNVNEYSETIIIFFNENGQPVFTSKARGKQQINISKLSSATYVIKTSTGKEGWFVKQ